MPSDHDEDFEYDSVDVRSEVAGNPHTPVEVLEQLLQDEDERVWASLAQNPNLPEYAIEDFATSTEYVRECLTTNPSLPSRLFDELSSAYFSGVRSSLGEREDLPLDILLALASDESELVRKQVAKNPAAPFSLREKLARDKKPAPGGEKVTPFDTNRFHGLDRFEKLQAIRSAFPLELEVQIALSLDAESAVRRTVASSNWLSRDILKALGADSSIEVRVAVAANWNTDYETLELLADDSSDSVRAAVAGNLNAWDLKHALASQPSALVRAGVASNRLSDVSLLEKLSADPSAIVRQAVARNRRSPVEVLRRLAEEH